MAALRPRLSRCGRSRARSSISRRRTATHAGGHACRPHPDGCAGRAASPVPGATPAFWFPPRGGPLAEDGPVVRESTCPATPNPKRPRRAPDDSPRRPCAGLAGRAPGQAQRPPCATWWASPTGGWVAMNQALRAAPAGSPPSRCSTPPGLTRPDARLLLPMGSTISGLATLTPMPAAAAARLARWLEPPAHCWSRS